MNGEGYALFFTFVFKKRPAISTDRPALTDGTTFSVQATWHTEWPETEANGSAFAECDTTLESKGPTVDA